MKTLYKTALLAGLMSIALYGCDNQTPGSNAGQYSSPTASAEDSDKTAQEMNNPSSPQEEKQASNDLEQGINSMKSAAGRAADTVEHKLDQAGDKMGDAAITAAVVAGLAKDSELSAIKIDVDTTAGVVTLNGPVPSTEARDRAERLAKNVEGVSAVKNQLTVESKG